MKVEYLLLQIAELNNMQTRLYAELAQENLRSLLKKLFDQIITKENVVSENFSLIEYNGLYWRLYEFFDDYQDCVDTCLAALKKLPKEKPYFYLKFFLFYFYNINTQTEELLEAWREINK